jgi:hypothetical protein
MNVVQGIVIMGYVAEKERPAAEVILIAQVLENVEVIIFALRKVLGKVVHLMVNVELIIVKVVFVVKIKKNAAPKIPIAHLVGVAAKTIV